MDSHLQPYNQFPNIIDDDDNRVGHSMTSSHHDENSL